MMKPDTNISITTGTIIKTILILLLVFFAYYIRDIILMIFISIILAAIIEPIINHLEEKKIPRGGGVIIVFLVILVFMYITLRLIIPPMIEQTILLLETFPTFWNNVLNFFPSLQEVPDQNSIINSAQSNIQDLRSALTSAASGVYAFVIFVFNSLLNFFLILVMTFYLVMEKDATHRLFTSIAPAHYHDYLIKMFRDIQKKIGDWARGQLILGLIIGSLSLVGLLFLVPKYALVLALIAGLTELIPYIGPIIGALPAVFLGFTVPDFSISRGLMVIGLYVLIQQLENNYFVPKVMQKSVGLNPVVVIIVMLIGARLAGIIGLIIAIPVATTINVIVKDFIHSSGLQKIKADLDKESAKS